MSSCIEGVLIRESGCRDWRSDCQGVDEDHGREKQEEAGQWEFHVEGI